MVGKEYVGVMNLPDDLAGGVQNSPTSKNGSSC